ncbi:MAG: hypothetical protein ACRD6W_14890 [Nitrososphaerales archaeon]
MASLSPNPSTWPVAVQLFAGHEIDSLKYEKSPWDFPDYYRNEYDKLGPALNVLTGKEQLLRQEFAGREAALTAQFEERLTVLEREMRDRLSQAVVRA